MTSSEFPPAESNVQSAQIYYPLIRYQCNVFLRDRLGDLSFQRPGTNLIRKNISYLKVHSLIVYVTGWYIDYLFLAALWRFLTLTIYEYSLRVQISMLSETGNLLMIE